MTDNEKQCGSCGHAYDPHVVIPTQEDPLKGGIILCPVKDCECFSTWSVSPIEGSAQEAIRIPDEKEMVELKNRFQKEKQ